MLGHLPIYTFGHCFFFFFKLSLAWWILLAKLCDFAIPMCRKKILRNNCSAIVQSKASVGTRWTGLLTCWNTLGWQITINLGVQNKLLWLRKHSYSYGIWKVKISSENYQIHFMCPKEQLIILTGRFWNEPACWQGFTLIDQLNVIRECQAVFQCLYGISGITGLNDGCLINIQRPVVRGDYLSRKYFYSVLLQGNVNDWILHISLITTILSLPTNVIMVHLLKMTCRGIPVSAVKELKWDRLLGEWNLNGE